MKSFSSKFDLEIHYQHYQDIDADLFTYSIDKLDWKRFNITLNQNIKPSKQIISNIWKHFMPKKY